MEIDTSPLPLLPRRPIASHKGTFGTVTVVGGTCALGRVMVGAPAFACLGALRAGAGLVKLLMPEPLLKEALTIVPSATGTGLPVDDEGTLLAGFAAAVFDEAVSDATALVVGPGMGEDIEATAIALRAVQQEEAPVIVDAGALNSLAEVRDLFRDFHAKAILTPHPGEFRRLAASLKITADPVSPQTRPTAAAELAQRLGCIVVLKGAGTVVSDGLRVWVCQQGHPCLATAGTGDVLSGVLGGLVAQFAMRMPENLASRGAPGLTLYDVARIAVQAHALAGERWAVAHNATAGLLASELADLLPATLETLRS
jgi:ADP-dependent NAD(P)H-hydrate dehydratase